MTLREWAKERVRQIIDKKIWVESGATDRFVNHLWKDIEKALLEAADKVREEDAVICESDPTGRERIIVHLAALIRSLKVKP